LPLSLSFPLDTRFNDRKKGQARRKGKSIKDIAGKGPADGRECEKVGRGSRVAEGSEL